MGRQIKNAVLVFVTLSVLTGVIYPFFITGIAKLFFNQKAEGSLIYRDGKLIGSSLIGQPFDDPKYFWGRPSATFPVTYNAASSSGSNLSQSNPALFEAVKVRLKALKDADPNNKNPVPVDLVTSSASGLDPHISLAAAYYQIPRIARFRGLPEETVRAMIIKYSSGRLFGVIGEPVVNVFVLNLALDGNKK